MQVGVRVSEAAAEAASVNPSAELKCEFLANPYQIRRSILFPECAEQRLFDELD